MNQRFVVDTSVVTKLYLRDERWTANADALFTRFERGEVELVALRLIRYEVPASIRKAIEKRRIPEKDGLEAIRRFGRFPLPIIDDIDILEEAFGKANQYSCSFYDAIFLTLAEDLDWGFVTADEKFLKVAQPWFALMIHLRDLNSL